MHDNLLQSSTKYKAIADQKCYHVEFDIGDHVWAILTKNLFSMRQYNRLSMHKIGPMKITLMHIV